MVGVEATPTSPPFPLYKGVSSIFGTKMVGVSNKFSFFSFAIRKRMFGSVENSLYLCNHKLNYKGI